MPNHSHSPILVDTFRGSIFELESAVVGIVLDRKFTKVESFTTADDQRVSPRSTLKPFQALPYLLSGSFDKEGRHLEHLALACASHQGEPFQIEKLRAWAKDLGVHENDLSCGPQPPDDLKSQRELAKLDKQPSRFHNNCSGKHLGMMATCKFLGETLKDYAADESQEQKRVREMLNTFLGENVEVNGRGVDGCGLPTYDCRLENLAAAWMRLLHPPSPEFESPCKEIRAAFKAHPYLIEGTGSLTSEVISISKGNVLLKVGAGGLYAGLVIDKELSFVFKCLDGQFIPAEEVVVDFLRRYKILTEGQLTAIYELTPGKPRNWEGQVIGRRNIRYPAFSP